LSLNVRHISKVDRVHYTVSRFPKARNPPDTCPIETAQDEQQIADLSATGLELFPEETRARINVLAEQANTTAEQRGVPLGDARDAVVALIQNRIPLVVSPDDMATARQATADLVATMIAEMKKGGMMSLHPLMLTQALLRFSALFPFMD
jgi:hypothetical protein